MWCYPQQKKARRGETGRAEGGPGCYLAIE
jgi:hypothetical protein